jgi:uncharacterized protein (TIGR02147 family)
MNVVEFDDYRPLLARRQKLAKRSDSRITLDFLAERCKIQKSYLSRVLNGHAHLSQEQLFAVSSALGLSQDEHRYSAILLERQRASAPNYIAHLDSQIAQFKRRLGGAHSEVSAESIASATDELVSYYTNPWIPVIHIYLCMPRYADMPKRLLERLPIDGHTLETALRTLDQIGVIEQSDSGVRVLKQSLHLPANHPLSTSHRTNQRHAAITAMHRHPPGDGLFFSASFGSTAAIISQLKQEVYQTIQRAQALCSESQSDEDVYHMNFDLFRI